MPDDPLEAFLKDAGIAPDHVGPDELRVLSARVTTNAPEEMILIPPRMPGFWSEDERPPGYFEIHDREWWIDARQTPAREYLITLIAAAAVGDALGLEHTLWWITKVLPATMTVHGAIADETGVHLTIARHPAPRLPARLTDDINPQDFADFVAALSEAAKVVPLPVGGTVTLIEGLPAMPSSGSGQRPTRRPRSGGRPPARLRARPPLPRGRPTPARGSGTECASTELMPG